jgi:hypothetical protein
VRFAAESGAQDWQWFADLDGHKHQPLPAVQCMIRESTSFIMHKSVRQGSGNFMGYFRETAVVEAGAFIKC